MQLFPSRSVLRVAMLAFIAAWLLWLPAFLAPFATGFGDWQFFMHMWEAGYVAVTRYAEWPLWDPFHCGGITIFGNPQNQLLSPLFLIALLIGPTLGTKIFVVVHAWAGLGGMYSLARRHGLGLPAALLAALAWAASGFFIWHVSTGHAAFLPFYFAPWVLLALRAALRDIRYAAALAGLLTLVLLEGGVYPLPFFVLLIAFDATTRLTSSEQRQPLLAAGLVCVVLFTCMAAVRLWPILDELQRSPRIMPSSDGVSPSEIILMLTAREHAWRWPGHEFVWSEYGNYVGWGVCTLGLLGALVSCRRGSWSWLLGALVFLALLSGDHGPSSAWSLLHRLPIYDSLRVPSRFCVLFTLYLALLAGRGLDTVNRLLAGAGALSKWIAYSAPAWTLLLVIAIDLMWVQYPTLDKWHYEPIRSDWQSTHFYFSNQSYGDVYASLPRMNLGSRDCYEAMNFSPARGLWSGDKPQARVLGRAGTVGPVLRTTSHASFDVTLDEPGRVLLNHNYALGWESNVGNVVSDRGRLALDLPRGSRHVQLSYRPSMLWPSVALSLAGLVFALCFARYGSRLARYTGHSRAVGPV